MERSAQPLRASRVERIVPVMASDVLQVTGIRCERCVMRLAKALEGHEGLESATANLMGQVQLAWDDERTSREAILAAMARAGFRELPPA
jgi:copper chaperone CopZ